MSAELAKTELVVLDFDNTLYDWVDLWYQSFKAMLDEMVRISGLPAEVLKPAIRDVHKQHRTSEYAFLIEKLDIIRSGTIDQTVEKYMPAALARREARRAHLTPYPGAIESLRRIKDSGRRIAIFTESQSFYSRMRFKKFGLDGLVDFLFTSDDHELPSPEYVNRARAHPTEYYELEYTQHCAIGTQLKPAPEILLEIIDSTDTAVERAIYIGDSKFKDVAMANKAHVFGVWAAYGEATGHPGYSLLQEVSHWTDDDIWREMELKKGDVTPDLTLDVGLAEILTPLGIGWT